MKHQQTFAKLLSNACRGVFAAYTCEVYTSDNDLAAIYWFRGLGLKVWGLGTFPTPTCSAYFVAAPVRENLIPGLLPSVC